MGPKYQALGKGSHCCNVKWQIRDMAWLMVFNDCWCWGKPSGAVGLALKLNVALLCDGCLLDRDHLSLHLGQFGRGLLVTADEERRRPEDDDRCRRGDAVLRPLTILRAGQCGRPSRYSLSRKRQLLAGV